MDINKIFNELINNNSRSSAAMIETLILNVLDHYSKNHQIHFITHKSCEGISSNRFDAIAPEGFGKYSEATVFEIKLYRSENYVRNIQKHVYNLLHMIEGAYANYKIKNLIIIIPLHLTVEKKEMQAQKISSNTELNIEIWDLNDLDPIFNMYPEFVSNTVENIAALVLNSQLLNSISNQSDNRDKYITKLKRCFHADELVLFLGAGVSQDAKIPMWDDLVTDLLVSLLSEKLEDLGKYNVKLSMTERDYIIEKLKKSNSSSPLLLARYIRQGLQEVFTETLTRILYSKCVDTSKLLESVAKLCSPVRNGIGVRGVVNYNFDDLLEHNFSKKNISYRSIFRESDIPTRDELGIYHVHGFLPREGTKYSNLDKSLLVFSEEGYHNLMLDPYSWSNLIQLNYLRENTCLFVGLSLSDPNLRRLLDIAARKQEDEFSRHFAILKRDKDPNIFDPKIDTSNIEKFNSANQNLQEEYYKELGLNIIWVDNYDEIPSVLDSIRG